MLTALIIAIVINILMLFRVLVSLQDLRLRIVAVGIGMQIISDILQQDKEDKVNESGPRSMAGFCRHKSGL